MKHELLCQEACKDEKKDILIVTHNNSDWLEKCVQSIFDHTDMFNLYIWDNDSDDTSYLKAMSRDLCANVHFHNRNEGFIIPNNRLAQMGKSPYVILLNSDTEVYKGWSAAMLGYLQSHPMTTQVGYQGGILSEDGRGVDTMFGSEVDYIMGWCTCLRRDIITELGLFDENHLRFALCEDADLSLRVRESGGGIHALTVQYVWHEGNVTLRQVNDREAYQSNVSYMQRRWGDYLAEERFEVR